MYVHPLIKIKHVMPKTYLREVRCYKILNVGLLQYHTPPLHCRGECDAASWAQLQFSSSFLGDNNRQGKPCDQDIGETAGLERRELYCTTISELTVHTAAEMYAQPDYPAALSGLQAMNSDQLKEILNSEEKFEQFIKVS